MCQEDTFDPQGTKAPDFKYRHDDVIELSNPSRRYVIESPPRVTLHVRISTSGAKTTNLGR